MKRKLGNRADWTRVVSHRYLAARANAGIYQGVVSLYTIERVREPLWKPLAGTPILVADSGFTWLQFYPAAPDSAGYCATAMLTSSGAVAQWYLDICAGHGLNDDGIPWHDDLYLDVISNASAVEIIDGDDLDAALEAGAISARQREYAWAEAHRLARLVRESALPEMRVAPQILAIMRALDRGEPQPGFTVLSTSQTRERSTLYASGSEIL